MNDVGVRSLGRAGGGWEDGNREFVKPIFQHILPPANLTPETKHVSIIHKSLKLALPDGLTKAHQYVVEVLSQHQHITIPVKIFMRGVQVDEKLQRTKPHGRILYLLGTTFAFSTMHFYSLLISYPDPVPASWLDWQQPHSSLGSSICKETFRTDYLQLREMAAQADNWNSTQKYHRSLTVQHNHCTWDAKQNCLPRLIPTIYLHYY